MTFKKLQTSDNVTQVLPEKKLVALDGMYLDQRLAELSAKIDRTLVITNFLTDRNGVIAKVDSHQHFQVPSELKNPSDWRLFQELMAQADVIISGAAYLKRVSAIGKHAEDVLFQFEPGGEFEKLGEWRLSAGYKNRSPDLAIVTHNLDFKVPEEVLKNDRKVVIFSTYATANSDEARALTASGMTVIGSGEAGVDGDQMIDTLGNEMGYRVIMMATGPSVLKLLLDTKRLDILYITEVQKEIPVDDPLTVQTILKSGKKVKELKEFSLSHQYSQDSAVADDGSPISQLFIRYDRKGALTDRPQNAP